MKIANRFSSVFVMLFLFVGLWGCQRQTALIIDVRSQGEYNTEHIANAILIPHETIGSEIEKIEENRGREIIIFCRSGHRAGLAKTILEGMGYTHVTNGGGLMDMKAKGYQ